MKKKTLPLIIICAVVVIVIAAVAVIAVNMVKDGLIYSYDFDSDQDKISDMLVGGAEIVEGAGLNGAGLVLDGQSGYMELPTGILKDNMSFIAWVKRDSCTGYERIFDLGADDENYFFFAPTYGVAEISVNGDKSWVNVGGDKTEGVWQMYAVTVEENIVTVYIDGEQVRDPGECKYKLSEIKDSSNYLGKSHFNDPYFHGTMDEIKIYNRTLSGEEISQMYYESQRLQMLKADAGALKVPSYTYGDIELELKGSVNGSEVAWKSSSKNVLGTDGKANPKKENTDVTLTAVLTDPESGISYEQEFTVTVVAAGAEGRLSYVRDNFDLGIDYIIGDIGLASEIDGVSIVWDGGDIIGSDGSVTRPDEDTVVNLKATFSYEGSQVEGEYPVTVAAKPAAYLATYISIYEYNTGVEFAEFPSHDYTDNARTDVMFYAVSEDGESYEGINNDRPVLYPYSANCVMGVKFEYQFGSPSLFRKPDGSYGLIAANNNTTSQVLIYDTTDLINFENQREVDFGITVKNPTVEYDNLTKLYSVYFESDDGSYVVTSADMISFSSPQAAEYTKPEFVGELPVYAKTDEAAVFELTASEYDKLMKKYGGLHSVSVEYEDDDIEVKAGSEITLPETATVIYNDGSTKDMGIIWDAEAAGLDLENPAAGTYTVTGKINRPVYNSPLAECRADPYVVYNEQDGMYYFTSSYMQADLQNAYAYVIIRRAPSINELSDAEEVIIWDSNRGEADAWYWAPELHYIGGQWRMILLSTWEDSGWEATLLSCKAGGDLLDPNNWEATGKIGADSNGMKPGAFDTTYFEYNGTCYYVTPSGNNIWIATIDPDNPLEIETNFVKIGGASYAWEYNNGYPGTICDHQFVNEASSIMIHDGKIYLTYAGSTIDMHYCIGLLYADLDDDILDPASWTKHPLPLLVTADLTTTIKEPVLDENGDTLTEGEYEGSFGPGHNSITYDENGNPVVIYHARVWGENYVQSGEKYGLGDPGRHAFARSVNFDIDGIPVMNMSPEEELSSELETVTVTVVVK